MRDSFTAVLNLKNLTGAKTLFRSRGDLLGSVLVGLFLKMWRVCGTTFSLKSMEACESKVSEVVLTNIFPYEFLGGVIDTPMPYFSNLCLMERYFRNDY